jgi:iron complex transport system ATP-binding protein
MSELLRAENISFAYSGAAALSEVSLSLAAGEIVAVVGPNGSGKSTLLKALLGHLRASGVIEWEGTPVRRWGARALAKLVAYLPQSPTWLAGQSVAEALAVGRSAYWGMLGLESEGDEKAVAAAAATLGITDLLDRGMDQLSGGQRQTVLLGRCLVQEPRAMLLDEPDTFLDLKHQSDLCGLLRKLARERAIGVLMASHDLNLAGELADRIVLLNAGKVAAIGAPRDVLKEEVLESVYGVAMERIERRGGGVWIGRKAEGASDAIGAGPSTSLRAGKGDIT